ncbi:MAG: hypothetical protein IPI18_12440 [Saprospiraceae bacterium]|nr:hypothetical protein [Saprospiraceae bacterium]
MKTFRRHYIMLRPSIIIIYDELKADHPAEWTWLLHNDNGFQADPLREHSGHHQRAKSTDQWSCFIHQYISLFHG